MECTWTSDFQLSWQLQGGDSGFPSPEECGAAVDAMSRPDFFREFVVNLHGIFRGVHWKNHRSNI